MRFGSLLSDDIFISYSRGDGGDYVRRLDQALTQKGYSCFTDHKGTHASEVRAARAQAEDPAAPVQDDGEDAELPAALCRSIRSAKMLIFVGTPNALKQQKYIRRELKEFTEANSTLRIVPISFDGGAEAVAPWEDASWWPYVAKKTRVRESVAALGPDGGPSQKAIDNIVETFTYTKSKDRLRRYRNGALALFLFLLTGSGVAAAYGVKYATEANQARVGADEARRIADERIVIAMTQAFAADALSDAADAKRVTAEAAATKAQQEATEAARATEAAEVKRVVAENLMRQAEAQRQLAEAEAKRQQGVAGSRERASESAQLRQVGVDKFVEAVETARAAVAEAKKVGAATVESDMALRASLAMLPALRARGPVVEAAQTVLSPNAGTLVARDSGGGYRLLDTASTRSEAARPIHRDVPEGWSYAVSDGGDVFAVSQGSKVLVFDPRSGERLCEFEAPQPERVTTLPPSGEDIVASVALSPDGRYVAVAANYRTGSELDGIVREHLGVVSLWYVNAGEKKAERIAVLGEDFSHLSHIAFGPGGRVLGVGGRGGAILWYLGGVRDKPVVDAGTKDPVEPGEFEPSAPSATALPRVNEYQGALARDFERVVVPQEEDENVWIIAPGADLEQLAFLTRGGVTILKRAMIGGYEPSAYLPSVSVSGLVLSGETLSVVSGGKYEVWNSSGYTAVVSIPSDDEFLSISFNGSNNLLALTQDREQKQKTSLLWPAAAVSDEPDDPRAGGLGGKFKVVEEDGALYVVGPDGAGKSRLPHSTADDPNIAQRLNLSDDGSLVVELPDTSGERTVRFFRRGVKDFEPRGSIEDYDSIQSSGTSVISHDGRFFAYTNFDGKLSGVKFIADKPAARVNFDARHGGIKDVSLLLFSPGGRYLSGIVGWGEGASATGDEGTLVVFRTADGVLVRQLVHKGNINDVTFSDDETYIATASSDRAAHVINIVTGNVQRVQHMNFVYKVAFSPDAETLATVSIARDEAESSEIRYGPKRSIISVFDVRRGLRETARFFQREYITLLSFNRDGKYLATAGELERQGPANVIISHRAVVWNVKTDDLVAEAACRLKSIAGAATPDCLTAKATPE